MPTKLPKPPVPPLVSLLASSGRPWGVALLLALLRWDPDPKAPPEGLRSVDCEEGYGMGSGPSCKSGPTLSCHGMTHF